MKRLFGLVSLALLHAAPAGAEEALTRWRIDAVAAYSNLSDGLKPWRETAVVATYRPAAAVWLSAGLERSERFGIRDDVGSVRVARTFTRGAAISGALAVSPDAHFRAQSSLQLSATTTPVLSGQGWRVVLGLDATASHYEIGDVQSLQPLATISTPAGYAISARLIEIWDENRRRRTGYSLRVEAPLNPRARISITYADAPETDAGRTIATQSFSGSAGFDLSDATSLRMTGTHETRPSFDRDELALSVARRF